MRKTQKMPEIEERIGEPLEKYLARNYVYGRMSANEVGERLGVYETTIYRLLRKYGIEFSGFYKGLKDSKFRVYIAGLRKLEDSPKDSINPELLTWKMDKNSGERKSISKKKRKHVLPEAKKIEKEYVTSFSHTTKAKDLDDLVRESLQ